MHRFGNGRLQIAARFGAEVWDFFSVVGEKGSGRIDNPDAMPGARFFADGKT